jgi:hypothetical protein
VTIWGWIVVGLAVCAVALLLGMVVFLAIDARRRPTGEARPESWGSIFDGFFSELFSGVFRWWDW